MQIRYTIILFCVFTTIFVSCKDDKQTDSNAILKKVAEKYGDRVGNYKFTVQIPNDWIRTDTTIQGLKLTLIQKKKQDDHFGPNINVLDESIGNRSPADYVKASQKYMVDNMPGITNIKTAKLILPIERNLVQLFQIQEWQNKRLDNVLYNSKGGCF